MGYSGAIRLRGTDRSLRGLSIRHSNATGNHPHFAWHHYHHSDMDARHQDRDSCTRQISVARWHPDIFVTFRRRNRTSIILGPVTGRTTERSVCRYSCCFTDDRAPHKGDNFWLDRISFCPIFTTPCGDGSQCGARVVFWDSFEGQGARKAFSARNHTSIDYTILAIRMFLRLCCRFSSRAHNRAVFFGGSHEHSQKAVRMNIKGLDDGAREACFWLSSVTAGTRKSD